MRVTEYLAWAFVAGSIIGWLWTRWNANQPQALISSVLQLREQVLGSIETFAGYIDLTQAQQNQIKSGRIVADWDELFRYYKWAAQHRFDGQQKEPFFDPTLRNRWKSLDLIALTALAIICSKLLGKPECHATYVLLKAKNRADYRSLLAPTSDTTEK
jgi:hypothetical protein